MPDTADPTFAARLPVSGDVDDLVAIFNLAVANLRAYGLRVDQVASLPVGHIPHRIAAVTATRQLHYDDGAAFWLLNPATALGGQPPTTIRGGALPDEGVSSSGGRVDHRHGVVTGPPSASRPGDAGSDGLSTALAAADHVHPREPGDPTTWFSNLSIAKFNTLAMVTGTAALTGAVTPGIPSIVGGNPTLNAGVRWAVEARMNIGVTDASNYRWFIGSGLPRPILADPGFGGGGGSALDVIVPGCVRIAGCGVDGTIFDLFFKYDEATWFISQARSVLTVAANAGATVWINAAFRV